MENSTQNNSKLLKTTMFLFLIYILFLGILAGLVFLNQTFRNVTFLETAAIHMIGICCLYFPVVSIEYGRRAYLKTQKIFFPCLMLFLTLLCGIVLFIIAFGKLESIFNLNFFGEDIEDRIYCMTRMSLFLSLLSLPVAFVISVISSVVTKFVVKKKNSLSAIKEDNEEKE